MLGCRCRPQDGGPVLMEQGYGVDGVGDRRRAPLNGLHGLLIAGSRVAGGGHDAQPFRLGNHRWHPLRPLLIGAKQARVPFPQQVLRHSAFILRRQERALQVDAQQLDGGPVPRLADFELREQLAKLLETVAFSPYTTSTICTSEALMAELVQVRINGYTLDQEEREVGLFCISAPVVDANGECVAANSISLPAGRAAQHSF